jgi:hypothetical protein
MGLETSTIRTPSAFLKVSYKTGLLLSIGMQATKSIFGGQYLRREAAKIRDFICNSPPWTTNATANFMIEQTGFPEVESLSVVGNGNRKG